MDSPGATKLILDSQKLLIAYSNFALDLARIISESPSYEQMLIKYGIEKSKKENKQKFQSMFEFQQLLPSRQEAGEMRQVYI